jgi:hypothetical protein
MPDDNVIHVGAIHCRGDIVTETLFHQTCKLRITELEIGQEILRRQCDSLKNSNIEMMTAAMRAGVVFTCGKAGFGAEYKPELAKTLLHLDSLEENERENFLKEADNADAKE